MHSEKRLRVETRGEARESLADADDAFAKVQLHLFAIRLDPVHLRWIEKEIAAVGFDDERRGRVAHRFTQRTQRIPGLATWLIETLECAADRAIQSWAVERL